MNGIKYWAFTCHYQQEDGIHGGLWSKKTYELRKFETQEELDAFIKAKNEGEMDDGYSSISILATTYDEEEGENIPDEGGDDYYQEDEYEDNE